MIDTVSHLYRTEDILVIHEKKEYSIDSPFIICEIFFYYLEKIFIIFSHEKSPRISSWIRIALPLFYHIEIARLVGDVGESEVKQ